MCEASKLRNYCTWYSLHLCFSYIYFSHWPKTLFRAIGS